MMHTGDTAGKVVLSDLPQEPGDHQATVSGHVDAYSVAAGATLKLPVPKR